MELLLVVAVLCLLCIVFVGGYIYHCRTQLTSAEWSQKYLEQERRLKEAQQDPRYWHFYGWW